MAKVIGVDLAAAEAKIDSSQSGRVVNLRFTPSGQPKWTALSKEVADSGSVTGQDAQVAILMDNKVITAPTVNGVMTGDAVISGGTLSTREGTIALAATLNHGVLPLRLVIASIETVR